MSVENCHTFLTLLVLLSGIDRVWSQPTYEYDGVSTVRIIRQHNFTLKYPLGSTLGAVSWEKKLTVNVIGISSEKDLVFAIGTQSEYLAATIAYDGGVAVPYNNGEPRRTGDVFVTPPNGEPLQQASPTLEQQKAQIRDFRYSLVPDGTSQTAEWEKLVDRGSPMGENISPLIIYVGGDRENDITYLTMEKNGVNVSTEIGSTWGYGDGDDIFFFLTNDGINDEIFELTGITVEDVVAPTDGPTDAPTHDPSHAPTAEPTDAPTPEPTDEPTDGPTDAPTHDPTHAPTDEPTADPTADPTIDPTTCCCDDSIADLEAEIDAINVRIDSYSYSEADAPPIPPSMGFTDGDSHNVWTEYIDLSGKDIFIILLLLINFIGMICICYYIHSKEKRSVNGRKYAVQYDEDTDMEPINQ